MRLLRAGVFDEDVLSRFLFLARVAVPLRLIHVDALQLALELGRNGRRRFGRFSQHEALEAAAELLAESLQASLLELDQCILRKSQYETFD